jgi:spermidine synthase
MRGVKVLLLIAVWSLLFAAPLRAVDGRLLEKRESEYNSIFVYERDGLVYMSFGHNQKIYTESAYDPSDVTKLPIKYTRLMTAGLAYSTSLSRVLEIGFGGGRTAWYLHHFMPEVSVTSVELDPEVVALAKTYFGIKDEPNFEVVTQDGRLHLAGTDQTYDIILVDAYRGPFVPFHLLTKEFYQVAKSRLSAGGVMVQNIEPSTMLFDSAIATISSVFANVDLYDAGGNIVAVAYDGPTMPNEQLFATAASRQTQFGFAYPLADVLSQRRVLNETFTASVLTDDFAPVESLKSIERHNMRLDDISRPAQ